MPDDITVNLPETGDILHFPTGTDMPTIQAAMGKLRVQKLGSPEQNVAQQAASQATGIGPKSGMDFSSPVAFGQSLAKPVREYFQRIQNMTPQGEAANPVQNILGKATGFAVGGNQGIGTSKEGILTNPVLGSIMGVGPASELTSQLPNAERAAMTINKIVAGAKNVEVPVFDATAEAARAKEIFHAGAPSLPAPIRRFMTRIMNPEAPPLNVEEARDFYVNSTKQTAKVWSDMGKPMQRQMAQFTKALGKNIEEALNASQPGTGTQLRQAMDEYHKAQVLKSTAVKTLKWGAGLAGAGAGTAAGAKIVKSVLESKK